MDELIPLSVLQLDLPAPSTEWGAFLAERHIPVRLDDLGRESVTREAARRLFVEAREVEARQREKQQAIDEAAVEADKRRRAQLWSGIPSDQIPEGVAPATAMLATAQAEARPRRESVLDHALSREEGIVFHPIERRDGER